MGSKNPTKMKLIIDRIEEKLAVCEDENGEIINIDVDKIVGKAKEGDIIFSNGQVFEILKRETEKRKNFIEKLTENMWED